MTDAVGPGARKLGATEADELPTAYGGTTGVEPGEPGQSIGQVPDPDDAGVDEAGDRRGPGRGDPAVSDALDNDQSGTAAQFEPVI